MQKTSYLPTCKLGNRRRAHLSPIQCQPSSFPEPGRRILERLFLLTFHHAGWDIIIPPSIILPCTHLRLIIRKGPAAVGEKGIRSLEITSYAIIHYSERIPPRPSINHHPQNYYCQCRRGGKKKKRLHSRSPRTEYARSSSAQTDRRTFALHTWAPWIATSGHDQNITV